MAQGCWSVGSVCATSYSWTTGPHRGAMESPQTAAGTRDPATPMVAVPAENGSTNLAGVRSPGIGSDGRLVQMSAKIPLRGCEPLDVQIDSRCPRLAEVVTTAPTTCSCWPWPSESKIRILRLKALDT